MYIMKSCWNNVKIKPSDKLKQYNKTRVKLLSSRIQLTRFESKCWIIFYPDQHICYKKFQTALTNVIKSTKWNNLMIQQWNKFVFVDVCVIKFIWITRQMLYMSTCCPLEELNYVHCVPQSIVIKVGVVEHLLNKI